MKLTTVVLSVLALASCSLAPDYHAPETAQPPEAYKESGTWVAAQPADAIERGAWWKVFHEPQLDGLEDQVTSANQNLKAAVAQYDQARAAAGVARASYFPTITGNSSGLRQKNSSNLANNAPVRTYNDYTLGADLTYEIDVFGRVRNTVAANEAQADASAADLATVTLSLHAELANDYFALRGDDVSQAILDEAVSVYQKALTLTQQRFKGGVSAEADVDQAETQLENAKTQSSDMRLQRAQLEHAIAILIGKMPSEFQLAAAPSDSLLPALDPGLPSLLLERRPDVAAAERRVAAANAEIGVARAAYFPSFNLTGSIGYESANTGSWFSAPSLFWAFGSSAMMTLFDGGAISSMNDEARAAYNQSVASYRETVLEAYQNVEDNLASLHHLSDESKTQAAATRAAGRALAQSNNRYVAGDATYLDVVVNQNVDLQAKLASINIKTKQLTASVELVKSLGGGWTPGEIAEDAKTPPAAP